MILTPIMESSLQNDLLDKHDLVRDIIQPTTWQKRLLTHVLDLFFFYMSFIILGVVIGIVLASLGKDPESAFEINPLLDKLITMLLLVAYNITFESIFGKTLGKMITNTKVVNEDGTKPSFNQIVGRSFARLIPFDGFSFLAERPRGWHDTMSGTMVVDDIDLYRIDEVLHPEEERFE